MRDLFTVFKESEFGKLLIESINDLHSWVAKYFIDILCWMALGLIALLILGLIVVIILAVIELIVSFSVSTILTLLGWLALLYISIILYILVSKKLD